MVGSGIARIASLKNGWLRLEFGFARAVFLHVSGRYEGTVFWAVVERSWGAAWLAGGRDGSDRDNPQPIRVTLAIKELARDSGLDRNHLRDAKRSLIEKNILIEHEDGSLEPNKRYDTWNVRCSERSTAYCIAGGSVAGRVRSSPRRGAISPPVEGDRFAPQGGTISPPPEGGRFAPLYSYLY